MLYIAHAVMALARAPKSRAVDNACNVYWSQRRDQPRLEVPDWAIDGNTARGRARGRTERSTYDSSYGISNAPLRDEYVGVAHKWMSDYQVERHAEPHEEHPGG
jgi:replication-associated recombination protein RarA